MKFIKRLHVLSSIITCALFLTPAPAPAAEDFAARTFTNTAGATLPYRLLSPQNYDTNKTYPLVLFLHGAGERGDDNQKQLTHGTRLFTQPAVREKFPCFVVAPQCPTNQQWVNMPWTGNSGVRPAQPSAALQLTLQLLDALPRQVRLDTNRVYVTGLSMGGFGTWDAITRFPARFAAAAPICGGGDEKTINTAVANVPVWAFHSDDDQIVKVVRSRNMIAAMRAAGGKPHYFEYFGLGHFSWGKAYGEPELLPWMFAQRRGEPDPFKLASKPPELPAAARWPASDDLFPGQGPLQKADWFKDLWRQRRNTWVLNRDKDKGAVVFLGDSITQGWGSLARDFANLKVANRGISGDTTRGVRYRLQDDVLELQPAAVVILIGTNDLGLGGEPEDTAANLREILSALKKSNPKMPIVLCRVMPRGPQTGRFPEKIKTLNQSIDTAAKGDAQITLCDTWGIFADDDGGAKKEEFPDLLHPNYKGYTKWAEALKPIFAKLNLGGDAGK